MYASMLFCYMREALGTLLFFHCTFYPASGYLRLVMRARGDSDKCKSIAIFYFS